MVDQRLFERRKGQAARISYFVDEANQTDMAELAEEYQALRQSAPRRTRNYLEVARNSQALVSTTRLEERLAAQLATRRTRLRLPDRSIVHTVDFPVPLKEIRADAKVGKIDLLGISDRVVVIEVKVGRQAGGGDNPLAALLEALSYAAMVEANHQRFAYDLRMFGLEASEPKPWIMVLGDERYWGYWDYTPAAEGWREVLSGLISRLVASIGLPVSLAVLPDDWESAADAVTVADPLMTSGQS
jgi:hypothetical protein